MFLLLIAAAKGFTEIIELMWSNSGLDVNKQDAQGVNAFWVAAWFGRVDVMR
jgi:ankyrin repeat protein